jgi:hypothetical protein
MPQGRGKKAKKKRPARHGGVTEQQMLDWLAAKGKPNLNAIAKRVSDGLADFSHASKAITAPPNRFLEADAVTRSTLQTSKMSGEERAALEEKAPSYIFRGDDALMRRTANGYEPTGLGALNFPCIAETRALWRRQFGCQLPTLPDLEADQGVPAPA